MEVKINNTKLSLIQGDITVQSTDAIVNAANSSLMGGSVWHGGTGNEADLLASAYKESLKVAEENKLGQP